MNFVEVRDLYTEIILFDFRCSAVQLLSPNLILTDGKLLTVHQEVFVRIHFNDEILQPADIKSTPLLVQTSDAF